MKATVANYFRDLLNDLDSVYYGFYFLELASYYTQENNDERQMLKLLYQSLRALQHPSLNNRLVKVIYELGTGRKREYPNVFSCMKCGKKRISAISVSNTGNALQRLRNHGEWYPFK